MVHVTDTRGIDSAPYDATPNGPETDARGGDSESEAMPGIRAIRFRVNTRPNVLDGRVWEYSLEELLADIPEPVPQSEPMPTETYDDATLTRGQLAYMTTIIAQVTSTMRYQALRGSYSKHSPERIVEDFAHALARELDGNYANAFNPANFLEQAGY